MKNSLLKCFVYAAFLLASLFAVLGHSLNAEALKPNDIRNYLGTRTPYRFKYNKDDSKKKFPNCKDTNVWMVIRHGTRLPSVKDILGMNNELEDLKYEILIKNRNGQGQLTKVQLQHLQNWSSRISLEQEKYLTLEGQDEMILLAERMQKRFPNAIKSNYSNKTHKFKYTATQRAQQSARYFTIGLFDKKGSQDVVFEPALKIDTTLRFYKHCDKWKKLVKKNPETYREQKIFANSLEMNETIRSVSNRLGLDRELSLETVVLMYKVCGYETSWRKYSMSPWCYGFDEKSIKVLEYYHDLKHYWLDGYGHNVTYQISCMLLKNMFHSISKTIPTSTFLFAHSGTMLKLLTHLELYKPDSHLSGKFIDEDRSWIASNIDCFASNVAFVLYKCKDGDKLLTLHQERVVKLPMCKSELCPLSHLKEYFHNSIENCDHSEMCKLE
ncbi:unnamed protein product, partial [Brenthis ino]